MNDAKGLKSNVEIKDSGIEWIGEIPKHWELKKVKTVYSTIGGSGFPDALQGREIGDYPFLKVSDINGASKTVGAAKNYITIDDVKSNRFKIVPKHSIIVAKIGEAMRKNHRKINTVECLIDNNLQAFVIKNSNLNLNYSYYYWRCVDMAWYDNNGTVPSLNNTLLLNSLILIPPLEEQRGIANYLDEQVGKIDKLIAEQKTTIEKWKAYKQSVIVEMVTKGLNPNAEMKDSGIEWIGEIPKEWEITKVYCVAKVINGYSFESDLYTDSGISIIRITNIQNGRIIDKDIRCYPSSYKEVIKEALLEEDDVLMTLTGDVGQVGIMSNELLPAGLNQRVAAIRVSDEKILNKFMYYLFNNSEFEKSARLFSQGTAQLNMSTEWLKQVKIPIPPLHEQQAITNYLDERVGKIDKTIERKQTLVKQLEEYKQSLIYECVTGKRYVL